MTTDRLDGKVAIVTGAGRMRGTGRRIAKSLAAQGADVVVTGSGRNPSTFDQEETEAGWRDVDSVVAECEDLGVRAWSRVCDVRDQRALPTLVQDVLHELGRIDILVNNVGAPTNRGTPALQVDFATWRNTFAVNVDAAFILCQECARHMIDRGGGGCIVNISSIAARMAWPKAIAYTVSKAALDSLTRALALEFASDGIRVNAVRPGMITSARLDEMASQHPEQWQEFVSLIPLGRPSDGQDVADMVVYLASERARWITGQAINVDGGVVGAL